MKLLNMFRRNLPLIGGISALGLGSLAMADGDPYAALITAVDFTTVTTDVVAVAALVVAVLVAVRAVRFIYSIVRS